VFDPLAIALIIAFNGLIGKNQKKKEDIIGEMVENNQKMGLYEVYGDKKEETPILVSEKDVEVFDEVIDNPPAPNEELLKAAEKYKEELLQKEMEEEYATLTDEEKKALEPEITDEILLGLKPDYNPRGIDLDGDGSIDGIDTNGDGMIDKVTAHPNRAQVIQNLAPYYARPNFNWDDRKSWINDQNAVNFWIKHIKPSQYPTDFSGKSY
jgi:hypothetical protein